MENFKLLGLSEPLLTALTVMQYLTPTPIQAETIPHALLGTDILGTAQTGTGKTAAYGIPLIDKLLKTESDVALVLTPTRELAVQVLNFLEKIVGRNSGIKTALIIGGDPIDKQFNQLRMNPRIIVGTPGRLNDHLERGTVKLDQVTFLVLDETDRMLDMGFGIQLDRIFKFLPEKRQTLMFSATLPKEIVNISSKYLQNALRISIGSTVAPAANIEQEVIHTSESEKYDNLLKQLELNLGTIIVFAKTKILTEKLAMRLRDSGHSADAIHGDLRQRNRERVIRAFRNKKHRILIATDIAARGLDISHVECVINHDLPQCKEDFIHRIGRTGRAGASGRAISLITPQDYLQWKYISRMMNPDVKLDPRIEGARDTSARRGRKPSFDSNGFKIRPSNGDSFRPRPSNGDSFRPRSNDDGDRKFSPRPSNGDSFRPRSNDDGDRKFSPRPSNGDSFRPRSNDGDRKFSPRPSNGDSFRPRSNDGDRKFSPRPSNGDSFRPRNNDGDRKFSPRPSNGDSFRPRSND
ncbi:MAG: DEAD/DEAH box helicase, partial [Rickettsiales bacterium]